MALKTRVALLAALMGSTVPAGVWAQTATTPAETPATTAATTPAATAETAAETKPVTEAATTTTTTTEAPAGTASTPAATETTTTTTETPAATTTETTKTETTTPTATTPAETPAATATTPETPAPATTDTTTAPTSPAAEAAVRRGPPQPAASAAEAQVGGFYLDSPQGDWQLRCQKTAEGKDPCELYQLLRDKENNPVAEVSVVPLTGKAVAGITIVAPLETDLLPGLGFKVDSGKTVGYPFSFCSPVGCFSRVAFSQPEVDALKKGSNVTVTLVPYGAPPNTKVDLALSLKGFTAGFDAVKAKAPAVTATPTPAPAAN